MEFEIYSLNEAIEFISKDVDLSNIWEELQATILNISDEDIKECFTIYAKNSKSISTSIKRLIDERLTGIGWVKNTPMFDCYEYKKLKRFSLDYTKSIFDLELAFNHESATTWNLIKGSLSQLESDLPKNAKNKITILITATQKMKSIGGFDGAIGTYEKYRSYIEPLKPLLKTSIIIIGLKELKEFRIQHRKYTNKSIGHIKELE